MSIGRYKAVIVLCYALPKCGMLLVSLSYMIRLNFMKTDTSIITHMEQEEGHNGLPIIKQLYQQTGAKIMQVSMYNKLEQRSYRCPSTTRWSKCHTGVHV
jgi:hypothetical protein